MEITLINNEEHKQYETVVEDHLSIVEYIVAQNKMYLTHTEVPPALNGKGVGSALVKAVLTDIEKKGMQLVPLCPFVAVYVKRHPEWMKLVGKGIKIV